MSRIQKLILSVELAILGGCVLYAQTSITFPQETGNNTSACAAAGNPSYCNGAFTGFSTNSGNTNAQTKVVDPAPGHVSSVKLSALMYPGFNGQFLCEYQPWFDNTGGFNGHKDIFYDESDSATAQGQDDAMLRAGCNINFIDWYGSNDPNQSFNLAVSNQIFSDITRRSLTLKLGILEDKGAVKGLCDPSSTLALEESCIVSNLIKDMDYINGHYVGSFYWMDGGDPVVGYFGSRHDFAKDIPDADWNSMWQQVQAHTNAYAKPFKYIFQFGSFSDPSITNGEYAWPQPVTFINTNSQTQFWWCSPTGTACSGYLDYFYDQGKANSSKLTVGAIYKGFDDSNASWGGNRIIAQQCGQVLLKTANEVTINGDFSSTHQIPYMQVATWNDYEEGTEVETGIDNCYTITDSVNQTAKTVNWTLHANNSYAATSTVHHFTVYYENPNDSTKTLHVLATNISRTTTSYSLANVPTGTWNIYVEMVGEPLILDRMSNASSYTH